MALKQQPRQQRRLTIPTTASTPTRASGINFNTNITDVDDLIHAGAKDTSGSIGIDGSGSGSSSDTCGERAGGTRDSGHLGLEIAITAEVRADGRAGGKEAADPGGIGCHLGDPARAGDASAAGRADADLDEEKLVERWGRSSLCGFAVAAAAGRSRAERVCGQRP